VDPSSSAQRVFLVPLYFPVRLFISLVHFFQCHLGHEHLNQYEILIASQWRWLWIIPLLNKMKLLLHEAVGAKSRKTIKQPKRCNYVHVNVHLSPVNYSRVASWEENKNAQGTTASHYGEMCLNLWFLAPVGGWEGCWIPANDWLRSFEVKNDLVFLKGLFFFFLLLLSVREIERRADRPEVMSSLWVGPPAVMDLFCGC